MKLLLIITILIVTNCSLNQKKNMDQIIPDSIHITQKDTIKSQE